MFVWLNNLKIAIVQKDTNLLDELLSNMPQEASLEEIESALVLMGEAISMMEELKSSTLISMQNIKKNLKFLQNDEITSTSRLDITY